MFTLFPLLRSLCVSAIGECVNTIVDVNKQEYHMVT